MPYDPDLDHPLPKIAAKQYNVLIHHVGRGHLKPAVTIFHMWHGVPVSKLYQRPTKTSVQRLLRLLKKSGAECQPGYPRSTWETVYIFNFRTGQYEPPIVRRQREQSHFTQ